MDRPKGFVFIIVGAVLGVLIIIAVVVVGLGCGEILQTRLANDIASARYVIMYANMKSKEGLDVTWPQSIPAGDSNVRTRALGGTVIGTFSATANTVATDIFGIVSEGTVNGHKAKVTVTYGFDSPFTNGYPLGSIGSMSLSGTRWLFLRSWVRAEGPLASGSTITTNSYVQVSGALLENQNFVAPSFWWKYDPATGNWTSKATYDTNGDGDYITDTNVDGMVTIADAGGVPEQEAIFQADNIDGNTVTHGDGCSFLGDIQEARISGRGAFRQARQ